MYSKNIFFIFIFVSVLIFLNSCSLTPSEKKLNLREEIPLQYNVKNNKKSPYKEKWWQVFKDEKLNSLIEDVVKHNLDLKLAFANINVLRTQYRLSKVNRYPVVSSSAGARVSRAPQMSMTSSGISTSPEINDSYSIQLNAMFEIDIFDKYGALSRSAMHRLKASEEDYYKLYFTMISQTIITYFDIKIIKSTIELYNNMIKTYQEELNIQKRKYETGLGMHFSINSLQQNIASNKAVVASLKKDLILKKHNIKLLRGKYPKNNEIFSPDHDSVIKLLEQFTLGVPSELLKNRHDILSAKQNLDAAREMIGYKKAERFPSISLSAALGFINILDLDKFFDPDYITMSAGVDIKYTIFSYGSKKANYEQAVEQHNIALINYKKTILNAFHEVEGNLIKIEQIKRQKNYLTEALKYANSSLDEAKRRFTGGIGAYQNILDLTKAKYNIEVNQLNLKKAIIINYINLYRSLGKK